MFWLGLAFIALGYVFGTEPDLARRVIPKLTDSSIKWINRAFLIGGLLLAIYDMRSQDQESKALAADLYDLRTEIRYVSADFEISLTAPTASDGMNADAHSLDFGPDPLAAAVSFQDETVTEEELWGDRRHLQLRGVSEALSMKGKVWKIRHRVETPLDSGILGKPLTTLDHARMILVKVGAGYPQFNHVSEVAVDQIDATFVVNGERTYKVRRVYSPAMVTEWKDSAILLTFRPGEFAGTLQP